MELDYSDNATPTAPTTPASPLFRSYVSDENEEPLAVNLSLRDHLMQMTSIILETVETTNVRRKR